MTAVEGTLAAAVATAALLVAGMENSSQLALHVNGPEDWWGCLSCPDSGMLQCLVHQLAASLENSRSTDRGDDEEYSHLPALSKPLMLLTLLRSSFGLILAKMSLALQMKLLFISLVGLVVNLYRLYAMKNQHQEPQKVVHYQHTQHMHGGTGHLDGKHDTGWMGELWENTFQHQQAGLPPDLHASFFYNNPRVPLDKLETSSNQL